MISFFKRWFYGNTNTNAVPKNQQVPEAKQAAVDERVMKLEAHLHSIQLNIISYDDKQKKLQQKVDALRKKAKGMISQNQRAEARKVGQQIIRFQKTTKRVTQKKKQLVDKKHQLEQAINDPIALEALLEAENHLKSQQKYYEKLGSKTTSGQQQKSEQSGDKMKDLVEENQQEEIQNILNSLSEEINAEKKKTIQTIKDQNQEKKDNKNNKYQDAIDDVLNILD